MSKYLMYGPTFGFSRTFALRRLFEFGFKRNGSLCFALILTLIEINFRLRY